MKYRAFFIDGEMFIQEKAKEPIFLNITVSFDGQQWDVEGNELELAVNKACEVNSSPFVEDIRAIVITYADATECLYLGDDIGVYSFLLEAGVFNTGGFSRSDIMLSIYPINNFFQ